MEKTKKDASGFVAGIKGKAENVLNDVQSKFSKAKTGDISASEAIHNLRLVHLIIIAFQTIILYAEEGIFSVFFPFLFLIANLYLVGIRWHYKADSRADMRALINANTPQLMARYSLALFGGFCLALIVHMFSPELDTILGSFFYNMSSYLSILVGAMTAGFEVYSGAQVER